MHGSLAMKLLTKIPLRIAIWSVLMAIGCGRVISNLPTPANTTLNEARATFKTELLRTGNADYPVEAPPSNVFLLVTYQSSIGDLPAYLSPDPGDGKKHPAIVWITGGDCNTIGDVWSESSPDNDQTARSYRDAGIIMMFPSLRGGNMNPGSPEGFLGEVDDLLATADYLDTVPYVDTQRIYLGGHSTGGTLALLVAESSDRFRAIFAFGSVDKIRGYGPDLLPFNRSSKEECRVRDPVYWLSSITSPVFVIEGKNNPGNLDCLMTMAQVSKNPLIHFYPVRGADHFSVLAPVNQLIAQKIFADTNPSNTLSITKEELNTLFAE